jgi:hypothetical protein
MSCICPDETYVLSEDNGVFTCTKTEIEVAVCPDGCDLVDVGNGVIKCQCYSSEPPTIEAVRTRINLWDTEYFEDASFTLAYSLNTQSWISYYDFKPNYYVAHNKYFQTGINTSPRPNEFGLWSHLLTNKSYGVFYEKKYEVGFEYPIPNQYASKTLEHIELWTEAYRYHNEHDYAYDRDVNFNKLRIFNKKEASGDLRLVPHKSLNQLTKYPKTHSNYQEVLATNTDDRWKVNYIYNRVVKDNRNQPIMNWDINQITRKFNDSVVRFKGKRVLEPIRGDFFLVYLGFDTDSRYALEFKFATSNEDLV